MQPLAPDQVDRVFQALADQHRRRLVERLARGPASVTELAAPGHLGLPAVLKHLRILEQGGIVVSGKQGRVRTYAMRPDGFSAINGWVAGREAEMHAAFDRLTTLMIDLAAKGDH